VLGPNWFENKLKEYNLILAQFVFFTTDRLCKTHLGHSKRIRKKYIKYLYTFFVASN